MRLLSLDPAMATCEAPEHSVACHDVRSPTQPGEVLVRKGARVARGDLARLAERGVRELHLAVPESTDVGEDEAARRLARAVAGPGVTLGAAHYGQVTLKASARGLLRGHPKRLQHVNQHDGVLVLISPPDCAADRGTPLGVVKCAPLFLPEDTLQAVEASCHAEGGVLEIVPFRPLRVAFIAPAERLRGNAFARSTQALRTAIEWFGSSLAEVVRAGPTAADVASGFRMIAEHQADVVLAAGAPATDPLDSVFEGLRQAGGEIEQIGIPAEPGTACWLGRLDGRPVLGLASCELFGKPGALDVLLPRIFAGEHLDRELLGRVALGGLLVGGPSRILPYHVAEAA